jgi:hypothetical protein
MKNTILLFLMLNLCITPLCKAGFTSAFDLSTTVELSSQMVDYPIGVYLRSESNEFFCTILLPKTTSRFTFNILAGLTIKFTEMCGASMRVFEAKTPLSPGVHKITFNGNGSISIPGNNNFIATEISRG